MLCQVLSVGVYYHLREAGNIVGKTRTLPLAVYSEVVSSDMHSASFYVVVIIAICFTAVILLNIYQLWVKKKRGF